MQAATSGQRARSNRPPAFRAVRMGGIL